MGEQPTPEEIFENISRGLRSSFMSHDKYGVKTWEGELIGDKLAQANLVLERYGLEQAEIVQFELKSEFGEYTIRDGVVPAQDTITVNLRDGRIIRCFSLTKFDDSTDVSFRMNIQLEKDDIDILRLFQLAADPKDPLRDLREHMDEVHEVSTDERLAISALAKILLDRNKDL